MTSNNTNTGLRERFTRIVMEMYEEYVAGATTYYDAEIKPASRTHLREHFAHAADDLFVRGVTPATRAAAASFYETYDHTLMQALMYPWFLSQKVDTTLVASVVPGLVGVYLDVMRLLPKQRAVLLEDTEGKSFFEFLQNKYGRKVFAQRRAQIIAAAQNKSKKIGSGTYGTVYRPPIGHTDNTRVGKVFESPEEWSAEKHAGAVLRAVNGYSGFLVLPEEVNDVNEIVLQLRYGYAGEPFDAYLQRQCGLGRACSRADINELLRLCIEQMRLFLDKYDATFGASQIVHLDIKSANVMYAPAAPGECGMRMIDFSLSMRDSDVFDIRRNPPIRPHPKNMYMVWPPELHAHHRPGVSAEQLVSDFTKYRTYTRLASPDIADLVLAAAIKAARSHDASDPASRGRAADVWGIGMTFILWLDVLYEIYENASMPAPDTITRAVEAVAATLLAPSAARSTRDCARRLATIATEF